MFIFDCFTGWSFLYSWQALLTAVLWLQSICSAPLVFIWWDPKHFGHSFWMPLQKNLTLLPMSRNPLWCCLDYLHPCRIPLEYLKNIRSDLTIKGEEFNECFFGHSTFTSLDDEDKLMIWWSYLWMRCLVLDALSPEPTYFERANVSVGSPLPWGLSIKFKILD